ncbi:hypothetical protein [Nocardia blacklockiae]|uniref:hypothetical protein n=1 Tax=Nocardia blacklockiae TaxID=480036 RepID=UPI0018940C8B|nr:hypothetical protein [Nocardia blacklockiae]MBF6171101.1 hypothetical protein [Nocardia blacklockiae]
MPPTPPQREIFGTFVDIDDNLFEIGKKAGLYTFVAWDCDNDFTYVDFTPETLDQLLLTLLRERGLPRGFDGSEQP